MAKQAEYLSAPLMLGQLQLKEVSYFPPAIFPCTVMALFSRRSS